MNLDLLKRNVGQRVQLEPIACQLDEAGNELKQINDDWLIQEVRSDIIRIDNVRTSHVAKLGKDHVHHYTSNPNRFEGGYKYGFLTLHVQIFLQGVHLWIRPTLRPGERVSPHHKAPPITAASGVDTSGLSGSAIQVIRELSNRAGVWSGTPLSFNVFAARAIYGAEFGDLLVPPVDYYSALIIGGYIAIESVTDHGNRLDGTPVTTVTLELTAKGHEALRQSNLLHNADARQNAARTG